MMDDEIDRAMARLAAAPVPARLKSMDSAVFARLRAEAAEARSVTRLGMAATIGALAIGVAGSAISAAPAPPLSPFGVSAPFAPSTLLATSR
jgi:hypothetical protein